MQQRWTLHVRNFGPIQSADIDIHPFMMFVGPNNSGKSYLTTLIWGLLTHGAKLFIESPERPMYQACCDWFAREEDKAREYFKNNMEADYYVSQIGKQEEKLFVDCFNESVRVCKKDFLNALFNSDVIDIEELKVSSNCQLDSFCINWKLSEGQKNQIEKNRDGIFFYCLQNSRTSYFFYIKTLLFLIMKGAFNPFSNIDSSLGMSYRNYFRQEIYLPSARTGFMLNFRSLASSAIKSAFSDHKSLKNSLASPTIHFLQDLIEMPKKQRDNRCNDIIEWLEKEVIKGDFVRQDDVLPDYYYIPQRIKQELPLYVCSSLVTELAPLILFLQENSVTSWIIEEPEAHLHPAAQRKVAQALVRLVNKGLPVWITTHSDIMFQQFNNLITLSHLPNRAEICQSMGYEESDILNPDDAMAYQFVMEEGGTVVKPLRLTETGFEAPSFNQTLSELAAETIRLHDLMDELENSAS